MTYDAVIVGARCAGSPLAILLKRQGWNVVMIDRAEFPSDTVSTHIIHPIGVAALARWGLRDPLAATGCPPIDTYVFDFGTLRISGAPGTQDAPVAYCPRRTVLDKLLVDAAAEAGAEIREAFTVDAVLMEGSANIDHETQDLRVVVVPEINAMTASLVATAINPVIGLGSFLAQVFLRGPLIEAATQEFRIDGTWTDPRVVRIPRRSRDPAPAADAPPRTSPARTGESTP